MKRALQNPYYWTIGALVVALLPQLASMPGHLVPITLVPVAWRFLAEVRGWKPLHFVLRIMVTAITSYALVVTYGTLLGRRAAVSLLALMLSLKLLETFKVRDARIVASLSLFLCATQFLFSQNMGMLVYGGACIITSMMSLTLLQRSMAFEKVKKDVPRDINLLTELRFSSRLMAISLPIALVLFLFFPRWGSPLWGVPEDALDAKSGLSNSMTPGSIQSLFMDDSPAFRVEFHSSVPSRSALYWRGPVFWQFDGATWEGSFYGDNVAATRMPSEEGARWRYTIQLEPNERHSFFALDYPTSVPAGTKILTMDYQLKSRQPVTKLTSYTLSSNPSFIDSPKLRSIIRSAALDLPQGFNPRTRELMKQWRAEEPDDALLALRVFSHFNSEEFFYTLNPPLLSGDTVDEFLFDTRRGFCEHYASAFTVMMRMAGIPARVVTGYQGGWYNEMGDYFLVRQSDAHAWSEIWLEGKGWTRVDPTAAVAPNRIEQNALDAMGGRRHVLDFAWLRSARNGFDLLNRVWNDWVIRFDSNLQSSLLRPLGIGNLSARGLVVLLALFSLAIGMVIVPIVLKMRQGAKRSRADRFWSKFWSRLEKAGVQLSRSMGPKEVATAAALELGDKQLQILQITDLYTRLKYDLHPPDETEFISAVRSFRA